MTIYELRLSRFKPGTLQSGMSTWTSMSDVGQLFDDGPLSQTEYERVEQLYLDALQVLLDGAGRPALTISDLRVSATASDIPQTFLDGAQVETPEALEICRLELRDELSCRLDDDSRFYIHVGLDLYIYVGCDHLENSAIAAIERLGLFLELKVPSPYSTT